MTKRSRRRRKAPAGRPRRRFAPLPVRLIISAGLVIIATGVSVAMERVTTDRVVIIATALVVLFALHIAFFNRLNEAYLRWANQRAARRTGHPEPPPAAMKTGDRGGRERVK